MARYLGDPKARKADRARHAYDRKVRDLGRINAYFGDTPMGAIAERALRQYAEERLEQPLRTLKPGSPDARPVGEGTVRKAVANFADNKKVFGLPQIWVRKNAEHRTRDLTRSECARLVGAALGFAWDTAAGDWKRETVVVEGHRVCRLLRRPPAEAEAAYHAQLEVRPMAA